MLPLVDAVERIFNVAVVFIFWLIPVLTVLSFALPDVEPEFTSVKYAPLTQPLPETLYQFVLPLTLVPVLTATAVKVVFAVSEPVTAAVVDASERIFIDAVVFICF